MRGPRFWTIVALMAATLVLMRARGDVDRVPEFAPLSQFPPDLDGRFSTEVPIDPEALELLGKGYFLSRNYRAESGDIPDVGLFVAFFPTQRTGQSIHSPQHCLPGAGWTFEKSGTTALKQPGKPDIQVGEYTIANGTSKDEVLYWYRSHGRAIASDYTAKMFLLWDSMRYQRTDAALVRVITPIVPGESVQSAHDRAVKFAETMNAQLSPYIPD